MLPGLFSAGGFWRRFVRSASNDRIQAYCRRRARAGAVKTYIHDTCTYILQYLHAVAEPTNQKS
jgi:hypothetical protein